jgi:DMSO/TMAO reductase YedYZ molybdopterin-dependent catalytic subunit
MSHLSRRKLLYGSLATLTGAAGITEAARLAKRYGLIPPDCGGIYGPGETLTYACQRLLTAHTTVREFPRSMISKRPFANAIFPAHSKDFKRLQAGGFRDWRLQVNGTVAHPLSLSLADLKSLGMRNQITEVACEEGWSYIAEWIGTPLSAVLREAGVLPETRYIVYYSIQGKDWWDSIDMAEAMRPSTLLTMGMNDGDLPVPFGGPLRMRLPRQLGYKSVKYLAGITATDDVKKFGKGLGSAAPEGGYAWYAGI